MNFEAHYSEKKKKEKSYPDLINKSVTTAKKTEILTVSVSPQCQNFDHTGLTGCFKQSASPNAAVLVHPCPHKTDRVLQAKCPNATTKDGPGASSEVSQRNHKRRTGCFKRSVPTQPQKDGPGASSKVSQRNHKRRTGCFKQSVPTQPQKTDRVFFPPGTTFGPDLDGLPESPGPGDPLALRPGVQAAPEAPLAVKPQDGGPGLARGPLRLQWTGSSTRPNQRR